MAASRNAQYAEVAEKGAAVVVPAQIVAQHLEGLHMRDPF